MLFQKSSRSVCRKRSFKKDLFLGCCGDEGKTFGIDSGGFVLLHAIAYRTFIFLPFDFLFVAF